MKPVNKTRRTIEHSGMLEETIVYCRNARRIVRVKEKRGSRKADRAFSKLMIRHNEFEFDHEYDHCHEFESVTGYLRWKYVGNFMKVSISEFTHLPWWVLIGKVRYQDGFRTWYR